MALTGWPTDAGEGAVATEDRWIQMARLWTPEGVVSGITGGMAPSFSAGQVTIATGAAWINGHYAVNDAAVIVPVTADGIVVLRYTAAGSIFSINFRAGVTTPSETAAVYETVLAQMTGGVMADRRVFTSGNGGARGVLNYAQVIVAQTGITTLTDVTGLSIAVPVGINRRIKITAHLPIRVNGVAGTDRAIGSIYEGTATELGRFVDFVPSANGARQIGHGAVIITPGAALRNYRLRLQRSAGAGTVETAVADVSPGWIMAEDIGPA